MAQITFTLYVSGRSSRSERAIMNLRRFCADALGGACEMEVVDVLLDPDVAEEKRILTTPTLIKESPTPTRRVTGDLSDAQQLMHALALEPVDPSPTS